MNQPFPDELARAQQLHDCAMDHAEEAMLCQIRGDRNGFLSATQSALHCEMQAASIFQPYLDFEPSRSVMHRSAAALALDLREWRTAERLVCTALAGNPPNSIAEELRDLLEQTQFDHHFQIKGVELSEHDTLLTLAGPAVAPGLIEYREFKQRADATERLFFRTAERRLGLPYRDDAYVSASMFKHYGMHLGLSLAASYAMPLRLGSGQLSLPGMSITPDAVVDEVIDCIELIDKSEEALRQHIVDPTYSRNFVGLYNKLAPDGDRISVVGLTVLRNDKPRTVKIRPRTRGRDGIEVAPVRSLRLVVDRTVDQLTPSYIVGYLRTANKIGSNTIRLETDDKKVYTVKVPTGMMNDIVRPLWDQKVMVTGRIKGTIVEMEDISFAPD